MRYTNAIRFAAALPLLIACKTAVVCDEVPAHIVAPTDDSRAELRQIVSAMLGARVVTIADDALTTESMLVIEPKNLTGRDLGRPDQFRLLLRGSECVLVHLGSGARSELTRSSCVAE
jgi:hypothetical protein